MSRSTTTRTSRTTRSRSYVEYDNRRGMIIEGNTARKFDVREEIYKEPAPVMNPDMQRRAREKHSHMNVGYVAFLAVAVMFSAFVLFNYIQLQTQNTALKGTIAQKESQLNAMKMANEEEYSRIVSSVDLAHVKDVAINELGMQYAQEGQVVSVAVQGDDYVRQYEQMP